MATLALAAAGAAVGNALLPAGVTVLGATMSGAAIGAQVGALAGAFVDQALVRPSGQSRTFQGPRLSDLHVTASTEGSPIPRIYGRARLGGQVIWATPFEEQVITTTQHSGGGAGGGGKGRSRGGGGGSSGGATVTQIEYRYYANFAVAVAEGPISAIGRIWADGRELDQSAVTLRVHPGTETQEADALIVAREGADRAPTYRGTAYVVFEHLALAPFGNRIPQLSFEVHRAIDAVHAQIRSVVLIPGSGEFVYATEPVTRLGAGGARVYENVHTQQGSTDWGVAIDQLQASLPNVARASLVVSWFGSDLRAGECRIKPGVELATKDNAPSVWAVAGLARGDAHVVSRHLDRPAFGGTPSDATVIAAIRDLKARGIAVTLTPFILMDIPAGNALTDPYGGAGSQPVYPWRGRITLDPAPGQAGTPDKTAAAATQIGQFVGTASAADFALSGDAVIYSGPDEWTLRRQVLHYAWLAVAAGGVDAFVIGSELRGLTQARSGPASYPFVTALVQLAADVRSILGSDTRITYAADWSEYFGHQPQDGSGDVCFHLDPLWASASIDAIGIDLYWPLADWRAGSEHADRLAGARSIYDLGYLKSNIAGGEGYDWYYASLADRASQTRTPITDGSGKPWVFRYKDVRSWWLNPHYDRIGGVEGSTPTAWVPQMKPIWLMECGCPAVDNGANQPNAFVDPKSAESTLPYFSSGRRDDLIQRRYLQALIEALDPTHPGYVDGLNPASTAYSGRMIDTTRMYVYAWDARPFPAFPNDASAWGDGENWRLGHWLNGRVASAPLSDVVAALLDDFGFAVHDTSGLEGVVAGYALDRVMSAREALQPLELAFFFDAVESGGRLTFRHRGATAPVATLVEDDLAEAPRAASSLTISRAQETELPAVAKLAYVSAAGDYHRAIAEARRLTAGSGRIAQADLAIVLEAEVANATADAWLFETWAARERASLSLPPSRLAIEPGDVVSIARGARQQLFRVTEIAERGERLIEASSIEPGVYAQASQTGRTATSPAARAAGRPVAEFLDLPLLRGDEPDRAAYVAATQTPWPGGVAFYSSPGASGFELRSIATAPATTGTTQSPLAAGPTGRLDHASVLTVKLDSGELASVTMLQVLAGANTAAVRNADDEWEVLQFETAALIAPLTYELSGLLRGQAGTEGAMRPAVSAGARFVMIDAALTRVDLAPSEVGLPLNWRFGPASRDLGAESFDQRTHTFRGTGLRPLRPVHVRGARSGADLALSWIRQTRTGGDSWEAVEVPLGEEAERYEVDVLSGASVKRTLAVSGPSAVYTAAQQVADFGGAQSEVQVRISQVSVVWGRGAASIALV